MIDLLKQILNTEKFNQRDFSNGLFFKSNKETDYFNYWLIVKCDNLSSVIEMQDSWFDEIKTLEKDNRIDKNTSLLLLHELAEESTVTDKETILKIEEDPYQFKKYVLCYKASEIKALTKVVQDSKLDPKVFIEKMIIDKEIFGVYKENPKSYNWQSLVFRLSLKLPLLKVNVLKDDGLGSLFAANKIKVSESGVNKLNDLISEHFDGIINDEMSISLEPEDILEVLISIDKSNEDNNK